MSQKSPLTQSAYLIMQVPTAYSHACLSAYSLAIYLRQELRPAAALSNPVLAPFKVLV